MSKAPHIAGIISKLLKQKYSRSVILLKGPWGCGKTFFWKNSVESPLLKESSTPPIIYSSCFGVENVKELKSKIIWGYSKVAKVNKKRSLGLLKQLVPLAAKAFAKKNFEKHFEGFSIFDVSFDPLEMLDDGLIYCFDDVERKTDGLKIEELLGVLYHLIEKKSGKIILIMDENHLNPEDQAGLGKSREKLVVRDFELIPDIQEVYARLLVNYSKKGCKYLKKNKDLILKIVEISKNKNIRALERLFENVDYLVTKNIPLAENFLNVLVAYVFEHCKETPKGKSFFQFSPMRLQFHSEISGKKSEEEMGQELFLKSYFEDQSRYEYVSEFFELVDNGFLEEVETLKKRLSYKGKEVSETQKLLRKILDEEPYYQSEEELRKSIDEVEKFLEENVLNSSEVLNLNYHLKIFYRFLQQEVLPLETKKIIEKKLRENIQKNDDSVTEKRDIHPDSLRYCEEYLKWYLPELEAKNESQRIRDYIEVIRKKKFVKLDDILRNQVNALAMFNLVLTTQEFKNLWKEAPEIFFEVANESLKYDSISRDEKILTDIKKYTDSAAGHADLDLMDKWRVNNLIKATEDRISALQN